MTISILIYLILIFMVFIRIFLLCKFLMRKNSCISKQVELCKIQLDEWEKSSLNIRNIKHDIKNHLICIREYIERDNMQLAKKYIEDLLNEDTYLKSNSYIDSGNIVVDALLNYKNNIMHQLGINMATHIEIPYNFSFNDADICVILSNCLDNSIEAVKRIKNKDQRFISLEFIYRKNSLLLKVINPFCGRVIKDPYSNYVTTKNETENHGIGLISIKRIVKKYNGLVNITTDNNIFCVQILMYPLEGL